MSWFTTLGNQSNAAWFHIHNTSTTNASDLYIMIFADHNSNGDEVESMSRPTHTYYGSHNSPGWGAASIKKTFCLTGQLADCPNVNSSCRKHLRALHLPPPSHSRHACLSSSNVTSNASNVTSSASNVTSNQCREMSRRDLTHWGTFQACRTRQVVANILHLAKIIANLRRRKFWTRFWQPTLWIDSVATYSLTPLGEKWFWVGRR